MEIYITRQMMIIAGGEPELVGRLSDTWKSLLGVSLTCVVGLVTRGNHRWG